MTAVAAGLRHGYGFVITDTRAVRHKGGKEIVVDDDKKIHFDQKNLCINSTYGLVTPGYKFYRLLKGATIQSTADYLKLYNEACEQALNKKCDQKSVEYALLLNMHCIIMSGLPLLRAYFLGYEGLNVNLFEIKYNTMQMLYPPDSGRSVPNEEMDMNADADMYADLLEGVNRFIDISEKSKYVSDTCSVAIMNIVGEMSYYEENMYVMRDYLLKGQLPKEKSQELYTFQENKFK